MKKGDWVCVQHGLYVQHNFASKSVCKRATCEGTKEQGVPMEEVRRLVQEARRDGTLAMADGGREEAAAEAEGAPAVAERHLQCRDCAGPIVFAAEERERYAARGWVPPSRCRGCRSTRRKAAAAKGAGRVGSRAP